jgi:uncharacterized protein YbjT (DUF2867 family)
MRVVIFGATGTVGAGVLLECLDSPAISEVLCVVRRPTGRTHDKLREIVHADFSDFSAVAPELSGLDACFWGIGIPSSGLTEAQYAEVTHDYTVAAARVLHQQSPELRFVFVSGAGADETEEGRTMWARVKGRAENAILAMGFRDAVVFRPAMIETRRGLKHSVKLYGWVTLALTPLRPLLRALGNATSTEEIGKAMIAFALGEGIGDPPKPRLDSGEINALARRVPDGPGRSAGKLS